MIWFYSMGLDVNEAYGMGDYLEFYRGEPNYSEVFGLYVPLPELTS